MIAFRWASALLGVGVLAAAGEAADQAKINAAIAAGGAFLKQRYSNNGQPAVVSPMQAVGGHAYGVAALSGMAMIEAGIPRNDPALQSVLQTVRAGAFTETATYHVVLAIMFLDRYGDQTDVPL